MISLDGIDHCVLKGWVAERKSEGINLEFKSSVGLPDLKNDREKVRLLKTVAAFANTDGGLIVYGIGEKDDRADVLQPFPRDAVLEAQLLTQANTGIEPKLYPPVTLKWVPTEADDQLGFIVVQVPIGSERPYMIRETGDSPFRYRADRSNDPMDRDMVRRHFKVGAGLSDALSKFHAKRLNALRVNRGAIFINRDSGRAWTPRTPLVMLHLTTTAALAHTDDQSSPLQVPEGARLNWQPQLRGRSEWVPEWQGHGVVFVDPGQRICCFGYCFLHNHGHVEVVATPSPFLSRVLAGKPDRHVLLFGALEVTMREALRVGLTALKYVESVPPYYVLPSVDLGNGNFNLLSRPPGAFIGIPADQGTAPELPGDLLQLGHFRVGDLCQDPIDLLRPTADLLWRHAGWRECPKGALELPEIVLD